MEIIKKRIADMERAEYNPRVELMPGDDEYEKLKRNIDRFGVVVPVIWNKRTNRVVSGHQRLTVLMNEGVTETDAFRMMFPSFLSPYSSAGTISIVT